MADHVDRKPWAAVSEWTNRRGPLVILAGTLLLFAVLKSYCFTFTLGDEHLYNYMSLLVGRGKWPYSDFFFAHPPVPLYVRTLVFEVTGYSLVASKMIPNIAAAVSAIHVYLLGRKLMGRWEGAVAAALFLLTFDVLRGSSHPTGANVALALSMAGAYQVVSRRMIAGGVLLALGALSGLYVIPLALMLVVLVALRSWREALRLAAAFAGTMLALCAVFYAVAGGKFYDQVVAYHRSKAPDKGSWFDKFRNVFFLNTYVMVGFLPAIAWAAGRWIRDGRERKPRATGNGWLPRLHNARAWIDLWGGDRIAAVMLLTTVSCGYFLFYSTLRVYYSYYFMLIMPWMALITGYVAVDVARWSLRVVRELWAERAGAPAVVGDGEAGDGAATGEATGEAGAAGAGAGAGAGASKKKGKRKHKGKGKQAKRATVAPAGARDKGKRAPAPQPGWRRAAPLWPAIPCAIALMFTLSWRGGVERDRIDDNQESLVKLYEWRDSPYLGGLNSVVRALFWNPVRDRYQDTLAIQRYLQHEMVYAAGIDELVAAVRAECRPGDRIFGEYTLGPFAAAVGDCELAADLVDTNGARLSSGESTIQQWIDAVEADGLDIAIVRRGSTMLRYPEMRTYLMETFPRVVFDWRDPYLGTVQLRRRAE